MRSHAYVCLLVLLPSITPCYGQQPSPPLKIAVLEGEGLKNSIKSRIGAPILIEVRDAQDKAVPGAQVIFQLPPSGASGSFPGGSLVQRTTTNAQGQAAPAGFAPNDQEGRLNIKVTASLGGANVSQVISQVNVLRTGADTKSHKKLWILLALGAAGGAGAAVALSGHGGSSPGSSAPASNVTLIGGTVTVGGPR